MGKKRIITVGEEAKSAKGGKEAKRSLKEEKGVRVPGLKGGERVVAVTAEPETAETEKETEPQKEIKKKTKPARIRGKSYQAAKAKVDPNKLYPLVEAIGLLKETSYSRFDGKAELHLKVVRKGLEAKTELPYLQAKEKKIAIADEKTIKQIEAGKIDFDILLSSPEMMPKLVKFAKILGPKGLMPNPKNNTLVAKPEQAIKSFQKASFDIRTEKDAPLIHLVFGSVKQPEKELIANLETIIKALGLKNIQKAVIKATMGPAIKVELAP
jgi:large subunit ribosomal protein L1